MIGKHVPHAVLMHWYVCGRKEQLATETIAHLYAPHKHAYQCPHGHHWHVGRKSSGRTNQAARQARKMSARQAWDKQAYRPRWRDGLVSNPRPNTAA